MPRREGARWYLWLAVIALAGTGLPLAWIFTHDLHAAPAGDAFYFHFQAQYIVQGKGWFISPYSGLGHLGVTPSAEHPPLWVLVLALADVVGIASYPAQLVFACALGAAAVFCTGLAAREVAGRRAGLLAAGLAALYPNFWLGEIEGMSETLVLLLIALVVLVAMKVWRRPRLAAVCGFGVLCGLAADTRAEQILLLPLVLLPLVLLHRGLDWRRRVGYTAAGGLCALVVIAPWVGFNLSRFSHHVYFSTDDGQTLAMANCRPTYYGQFIGSDDFACIDKIVPPKGDESVRNALYQKVGRRYMDSHITRLPYVVFARVGREFSFYTPVGEIKQEDVVNHRPLVLAELGLGLYYVMVAFGVYGAVALRRRRLTLVPYVGILAELVIAAAASFGEIRYRAPFEVVVVVLAAVGAVALWDRWQAHVHSLAAPGVRQDRPSVLSAP